MDYLEYILNKLQDSIKNLKTSFEKIKQDKEGLKLNIQNIFTKIRNELNNREDELLAEVDQLYNDIRNDEIILKQSEKLPNKVRINLERSKSNEFNDKNLALFIHECMCMEKNIKEINEENRNIKASLNNNDIEIQFNYETQLNTILQNFKKFGKLIILDKNKTFDTEILNEDKYKQESIINWIKESINKNKIKLEKIFSMKIISNSSKDFHNYCDNRGPTLTLIKTTKNKIFGGFTPLNFESYGGPKYDIDGQTFIFSLDSMKKYKLINKEKEAIYCEEKYGPYFGEKDFYIESNMKNGMAYSNKASNFNLEQTGGNEEYYYKPNYVQPYGNYGQPYGNYVQPNDIFGPLNDPYGNYAVRKVKPNMIRFTGGKGEKESFDVEDFEVFEVIY